MTTSLPHDEEAKASDQESTPEEPKLPEQAGTVPSDEPKQSNSETDSLKYSLLGPSLMKAGQEAVDQKKVSEIIYEASKGSKYFAREEARDKQLTAKITQIVAKKDQLSKLDLSREIRHADALLSQFEAGRDLTQSIVHIDCDAFYAAVELLDRPELADVPFAVGGGVLTTCNYAARKFGVRSGMAGFVAKKLCPQLILLKLNFDKYNAKAKEVRAVLAEYDPRFESASIDEAYLNITEYCREHGMGRWEVVAEMRAQIAERTKVTVSAGIAANSKLAKICSNMNKPNGQYEVPNEREAIMNFMHALPVRKVNGVGRVFERELAAVGIVNCGDIYGQRQYLSQLFGEKACEFLMEVYLGLGRTNIQPAEEYERKSVGTESTFRDLSGSVQLRDKLRWTAGELEKDMKRAECKGRTLCLKVKLHTFEVLTRQVVTPRTVYLAEDLYNFALPMLTKLEQEFPGLKIRLMGLRCTHLVSTKKVDTMAFFGFKRRPGASEGAEGGEASIDNGGVCQKRKAGDEEGEWETWPEEEVALHADQEIVPPFVEDGQLPPPAQQDPDPTYRPHGKERVPNPNPNPQPPEEWWDCPICARPQATNERQFNEHIDLCLSRQAIRDTIQEEWTPPPPPPPQARGSTPETKRLKTGKSKSKDGGADPRQKKLSFGSRA